MPDIKLKNQPFDLKFHPSEAVLYAPLLTGEVKCWRYDDATGEASRAWSVRPTKRTARCVDVERNGTGLWMGGKNGSVYRLDASMGTVVREHEATHDCPVNRIFCVNDQLVASGDDNGLIKFWDSRTPGDAIRSYNQHWDYISDFTYFEDKKQLVTTSGDGHLSVIDVRSSKAQPTHLSDDQEDELLSVTQIKGGEKFVVGQGLGVLSIWDRTKGWSDSVDRLVGHPASVDAVVALTDDIVATGSEDGMVRVIQFQPNSFLGVIATHDEYPIERLALDRNAKWLGSVSHDECIKLTDCEGIFEDDDGEEGEAIDEDGEGDDDDAVMGEAGSGDEDEDEDEDSDSDVAMKPAKESKKGRHKIGNSKINDDEEKGFFDDL